MKDPIILLRAAYLFNIIFLTPVCYGLIFGKDKHGQVSDKNGMPSLLSSAWLAIIFCSILGLFYPTKFWNILFFQTVYQFIFLLFYCLPMLIKNRMDQIPKSIAFAFGIMTMAYSIILTTFWFT